MGRLGAILGPSWERLRQSWGRLGASPLRGDPLFVAVRRRGLLSDPLPGHKWRYRSPLLFLNIIIRHLTPVPSITSLGPQNRDFRLGFSIKRRPVPPPDVIDAAP